MGSVAVGIIWMEEIDVLLVQVEQAQVDLQATCVGGAHGNVGLAVAIQGGDGAGYRPGAFKTGVALAEPGTPITCWRFECIMCQNGV
jgi:hypothetical protein